MVHGYIVIRKRNGTDGPRFPVKQSVKIGRGTNCDVRIHVQSVSEQHCLVLVEKGERVIEFSSFQSFTSRCVNFGVKSFLFHICPGHHSELEFNLSNNC